MGLNAESLYFIRDFIRPEAESERTFTGLISPHAMTVTACGHGEGDEGEGDSHREIGGLHGVSFFLCSVEDGPPRGQANRLRTVNTARRPCRFKLPGRGEMLAAAVDDDAAGQGGGGQRQEGGGYDDFHGFFRN